jgi:ParB family chromosome partitioning protein
MQPNQKPGKVLLLPLEDITPSPYQARSVFDDNEIAALAVSILQNGLLQPVSVRRIGFHKYQIVAGERRLRACKVAKLQKIPAILTDFEDSEAAALGLLENIQRSALDPFDTARGIREVIELWGCTQAEAARRLGLSQPALANKLRLLTLTPDQQKLCIDGHLTERHARAALRLPEAVRTDALKKMCADGMSVREADRLAESLLNRPTEAQKGDRRHTVPMVREVKFFVNTLQHAVSIMSQKGICATTTCGRRDGFLEYTVRIPMEGEDAGRRVDPPIPAPIPAAGSPLMHGFAARVRSAASALHMGATEKSAASAAAVSAQAPQSDAASMPRLAPVSAPQQSEPPAAARPRNASEPQEAEPLHTAERKQTPGPAAAEEREPAAAQNCPAEQNRDEQQDPVSAKELLAAEPESQPAAAASCAAD